MATLWLSGRRQSSTVFPNIGAELFVKRNWTDEWTWIPFVKVVSCEQVAAPSVGTARFSFRFGYINRAELKTWAYYLPLLVRGAYCKIGAYSAFSPSTMWVGKVEVENVSPFGESAFPSGIQEFTAFSIEHDLDRRQMLFSKTESGWVDRAISFNERRGRGQTLAGNKSLSDNVFGADGEEWTNLDIVNYIGDNWINYDPFTGQAAPVQWSLVGEGLAALASTVEVHNLDGMTPLQALNKLIDHRLGVGWRTYSNGEGVCYIYVYSTLARPMSYGSVSLPPNAQQGYMFTTGSNRIQPQLQFTDLADYDVVVARGGHVYSMFSLAYADATLEPGWTSGTGSEEEDYAAGSTAVDADADQHDAERNTDKFRNVYIRHKLPDNWDYTAGNGAGGAKNNVSPSIDYLGVPTAATAATNYRIGQEFQSKLLLEVDGGNPDEPEYRKPFAVVQAETDAGDTIWAYVDKLDSIGKAQASVEMGDNELAVRVHARPVAHAAALNHYDALTPAAEASNTDPQWDYETLIATVALRTDKRLMVIGSVPGRILREYPRVKLIEDPEAVAWYVVPNTVTDVQDGALVRHAGGVIRDDSERLRVLAARAMAWYGLHRATISAQIGTISFAWPVGSMIAGMLGPEGFSEIYTVVTKQSWEFDTEQGAKTTIETGFMELDFVQSQQSMGGAAARSSEQLKAATEEIKRDLEKNPSRIAGGSGTKYGKTVRTVTALPAIPSSGMDEVYWTSSGGGTGDDQVWRAYAGQTEWHPTQKLTTKSGTP